VGPIRKKQLVEECGWTLTKEFSPFQEQLGRRENKKYRKGVINGSIPSKDEGVSKSRRKREEFTSVFFYKCWFGGKEGEVGARRCSSSGEGNRTR